MLKNDLATSLLRNLGEQLGVLQFGEDERSVLGLFYDERLKVRRRKVPKFHLYARLCDGRTENEWAQIMLNVDMALDRLQKIGYVREAPPGSIGDTSSHVGESAQSFELTADGLEVLQKWHPPIALQLKAWIAVLPPWAVLAGSIAGAIGAIWKIVELGIQFAQRIT